MPRTINLSNFIVLVHLIVGQIEILHAIFIVGPVEHCNDQILIGSRRKEIPESIITVATGRGTWSNRT